jgi:deazaflavin-dependent oxidoreductase (nitroreductase family)
VAGEVDTNSTRAAATARRLRLRLLQGIWSLGNPIVILLSRWTAVWGVLETRGRRTGQARLVPLAISMEGPAVWVVVARGRNAAYVRNIEADRTVRIRIKGDWLDGAAVLQGAGTEIPDCVGRYARGAALLFPDQYRLLRIDLAPPPIASAPPEADPVGAKRVTAGDGDRTRDFNLGKVAAIPGGPFWPKRGLSTARL